MAKSMPAWTLELSGKLTNFPQYLSLTISIKESVQYSILLCIIKQFIFKLVLIYKIHSSNFHEAVCIMTSC